MSDLRRRCLVVLDGKEMHVTTSARDVANSERTGVKADESPMLYTLSVVHSALQRTGQDVPRDFWEFLDILDDFEDLESDSEAEKATSAEA